MASESASRPETEVNKDVKSSVPGLRPSSPSSLGVEIPQNLPHSDNKAGDQDHIQVVPRKSVSFSKLKDRPSLKMTRDDDQQAEGSEDEHTSMLSSHRSSGHNYSTVGAQGASSARSALDDVGDGGDAFLKARRKAAKGKQKNDDEGVAVEKDGVWSKLKARYGSVELENKGSVARDHLALERTFLAWLRTSLSFASIGIAVTQLFRLNTSIGNVDPNHPALNHLRRVGKPLGATFIGVAIVVLFLGFNRYFEGQHYVIRGKFPASRGSILILTLLAFALTAISLTVILVIGGSTLST